MQFEIIDFAMLRKRKYFKKGQHVQTSEFFQTRISCKEKYFRSTWAEDSVVVADTKKDNISLKTTLFVMAEFDADESCMKRAPSCHILLYAYTCFMTSSKLQLQAAIFFFI